MIVLSALYIVIVLNLAASWQIMRSVVVTHNATRVDMISEFIGGPIAISTMANATGSIGILFADSLLVSSLINSTIPALEQFAWFAGLEMLCSLAKE